MRRLLLWSGLLGMVAILLLAPAGKRRAPSAVADPSLLLWLVARSDPAGHSTDLRWGYHPPSSGAATALFDKFPFCGFDVYRYTGTLPSVPPVAPPGATRVCPRQPPSDENCRFGLPASAAELSQRIEKLPDLPADTQAVAKDALRNATTGALTEAGAQLWEAIDKARSTQLYGADALAPRDQSPKARLDAGLRPIDLLLLASMDPRIARLIGLAWTDAGELPAGRKYTVVAHWDTSPGPVAACSGTEPRRVTLKRTIPFSAGSVLAAPTKPDGEAAVSQVSRLAFDSPAQEVTLFGKAEAPAPADSTVHAPADLHPERPVVRLSWQSPDFVSYEENCGTGSSGCRHDWFPIGYNIYRAKDVCSDPLNPPDCQRRRKGNYVKINVFPTPAGVPAATPEPYLVLGTGVDPQVYLDSDEGLQAGDKVYYRVEAVDLFGRVSPQSAELSDWTLRLAKPELPIEAPAGVCLALVATGPCVPRRLPALGPPGVVATEPAFGPGYANGPLYEGLQPPDSNSLSVRVRWDWPQRNVDTMRVDRFYVSCAGEPLFPDGAPCPTAVSFDPVPVNAPACDGGTGAAACRQAELRNGTSVWVYYSAQKTLPVKAGEGATAYYFRVQADRSDTKGEERTSEPVLAQVADKKVPVVRCDGPSGWKPEVPAASAIRRERDAEGRLAVRITWPAPPPGVSDADGYFVYRAINLGDKFAAKGTPLPVNDQAKVDQTALNKQFVQLNREPVQGTLFVDRIEARATGGTFQYKLKVQDLAGNVSDFSCASDPLALPVTLPPMPPVITGVRAGDNGPGSEHLRVRWHENSDPVAGYRVLRATAASDTGGAADCGGVADNSYRELDRAGRLITKDRLPANVTYREGEFELTDSVADSPDGIQPLLNYCYVVEAEGPERRLTTRSLAAAGRSYDITPPSVPRPTLTLDAASGAVRITWPTVRDAATITVRRRDSAQSSAQVIGWWQAGIPNLLQDERVAPNTSYSYSAQAMDASGNASALSQELSITTGAKVPPTATARPRTPIPTRTPPPTVPTPTSPTQVPTPAHGALSFPRADNGR